MPAVKYTRRAIDCLREVHDYVAQESAQAAQELLNDIRMKCRTYAENPLMGTASEEYGPGIRRFPHGKYVVFYMASNSGIIVLSIYHGARNLPDIFHFD